ncbi:septal ring lytic transglycosylase RlpA family protein [Trichloromonas sp.]|uniref:septal ring lytic transglycosylase RlpA family protein n=1 Tax=Trichloromonas sp. TaxID=3069249 RepID=UPI003D8162AB
MKIYPMKKQSLPLFAVGLCCLLGSGCSLIVPPKEEIGATATVGLASYYHEKFQGRRTASGEPLDQQALTAAHRSYPFGTRVRVENLENGKTVVVRINDRGPFIKNRIIDLTRRAAKNIGMLQQGVVKVRLSVLK